MAKKSLILIFLLLIFILLVSACAPASPATPRTIPGVESANLGIVVEGVEGGMIRIHDNNLKVTCYSYAVWGSDSGRNISCLPDSVIGRK